MTKFISLFSNNSKSDDVVCQQNERCNQHNNSYNKVLLNNRGLAYADGFFTTMGVYQGHILWLDYHIKRLISHSKALQLTLHLPELIEQLKLAAKETHEGMLKLLIVRQAQAVKGYAFNNGATEISIEQKPMAMPAYQQLAVNQLPMQEAGMAVQLSNKISCLPAKLAGLKSLNRLDNVMVAGELERYREHAHKTHKHIVEGLVSDVSDSFGQPISWVEGTISNFFYQLVCGDSDTHHDSTDMMQISKNQWYTPPLDRSGVNGVMRQVIMDRLALANREVIERRLTDTDLQTDSGSKTKSKRVSAMFFCNSVRGIMPVAQLQLLTGENLNLSWDGL